MSLKDKKPELTKSALAKQELEKDASDRENKCHVAIQKALKDHNCVLTPSCTMKGSTLSWSLDIKAQI